MKRPTRLIVLYGAALVALAACASQPAAAAAAGAPGFWWGLLHGWIAPFALIGHIFDHDIRVYAFPNSGGWYDFGFLIGVGMLGGGAASSR